MFKTLEVFEFDAEPSTFPAEDVEEGLAQDGAVYHLANVEPNRTAQKNDSLL